MIVRVGRPLLLQCEFAFTLLYISLWIACKVADHTYIDNMLQINTELLQGSQQSCAWQCHSIVLYLEMALHCLQLLAPSDLYLPQGIFGSLVLSSCSVMVPEEGYFWLVQMVVVVCLKRPEGDSRQGGSNPKWHYTNVSWNTLCLTLAFFVWDKHTNGLSRPCLRLTHYV